MKKTSNAATTRQAAYEKLAVAAAQVMICPKVSRSLYRVTKIAAEAMRPVVSEVKGGSTREPDTRRAALSFGLALADVLSLPDLPSEIYDSLCELDGEIIGTLTAKLTTSKAESVRLRGTLIALAEAQGIAVAA